MKDGPFPAARLNAAHFKVGKPPKEAGGGEGAHYSPVHCEKLPREMAPLAAARSEMSVLFTRSPPTSAGKWARENGWRRV